MKNLGCHHDFYVQSDTLWLAVVFKRFRNKCIEIYGLDPAHFFTSPGLAIQAYLQKTKLELQFLTYIDVSLYENGIRGGICHTIHRYEAANNKYIKIYNKDHEVWCIMYWNANNLYRWAMSEKLPVDGFKR